MLTTAPSGLPSRFSNERFISYFRSSLCVEHVLRDFVVDPTVPHFAVPVLPFPCVWASESFAYVHRFLSLWSAPPPASRLLAFINNFFIIIQV